MERRCLTYNRIEGLLVESGKRSIAFITAKCVQYVRDTCAGKISGLNTEYLKFYEYSTHVTHGNGAQMKFIRKTV